MTDALYTQYLSYVQRYMEMAPQQRRGQAHFNVLYIGHPSIANMIRGTDVDPFYDDNRIVDFLESVYHAFRVIEEV